MKGNVLMSFLVVAVAMIVVASCEEPEPIVPHEGQNQTGRDPSGETPATHNTVVTYSECKTNQRDVNSIESSVRYENGILYFTHENIEFNCAINDVSVVPEINGQAINVKISEILGDLVADCNCPRDVNYTIDNIAEGHYNIVVSVRNDTIYQTEMDCHETHNTRVNYSECLYNQRDDSSITSSVRYENGTLYFTHENLDVNCGFAGITVEPEINGQTINVTIIEVEGEPMDCYCLINANYTIDNIAEGHYIIVVSVRNETIYQTEIDCHATHNTRVNYSECLYNQRDDSSITSSVRYENGTLYFTHENIEFNCALGDISVVPEINEQTITVIISEIIYGEAANCLCPRNVNYTIDNINHGTYTIIVKLHGQVIYQGEISC